MSIKRLVVEIGFNITCYKGWKIYNNVFFMLQLYEGTKFADLTKERLEALLENCVELEVVEVEITGDVRVGRGEEQWLNFVVKKV